MIHLCAQFPNSDRKQRERGGAGATRRCWAQSGRPVGISSPHHCKPRSRRKKTHTAGCPGLPAQEQALWEPRLTRALRTLQTSFSANIALSFDQPIKVAVRQRADRAIWRDGEAQCKVLQGRARRRPRGAWREETDGGEVSPAGAGLSELRGTQGGRKARPSFGCTCTLSPTNEKLKNQGGNDFPSCYVAVRRPTQRPKQSLREEIPLKSRSSKWVITPLIRVGSARNVQAEFPGRDPPHPLHKDNVPAQLPVQRILTRPSEPCRAKEPGCASRCQHFSAAVHTPRLPGSEPGHPLQNTDRFRALSVLDAVLPPMGASPPWEPISGQWQRAESGLERRPVMPGAGNHGGAPGKGSVTPTAFHCVPGAGRGAGAVEKPGGGVGSPQASKCCPPRSETGGSLLQPRPRCVPLSIP